MSILRIDSSANTETSVTRTLTDRIIATLDDTNITVRDLAETPLPQITHTWAVARAVPGEDRNAEQKAALELSDTLIAELRAADTIVIGAPVYNFSVPASLKAWIDLIARAGETFRYTADGPEGLIKGKRVIVAFASGGTPVGSEMDFASTYLRHVLGFIGITDVTVIAADALAMDADKTIANANAAVDALAA
ncbi:FMN-dependent NADH-azoreductase [Sulfitobacter brevis]|uniref:FMN dependent NADH:quinone oxidoreductase n=1 Tax=Sulfitobacter brevis TaxID=74348 RepID=A0A1I2DEN6_9RHOB|nr:NAD(P)H-dependent oxidoreductase [Sulfitobacter brevis]SFE78977.1 FMN-dependent NADH-azoreductase [Sulfitobacter brevis]